MAVARLIQAPETPLTTILIEPPTSLHSPLQKIQQNPRRGTPFERHVWSLLCQIPAGQTSTYGAMAAFMGSSPRAVGNALRRNPYAPEVPCHRIVATGGALGGFKGTWTREKPRKGMAKGKGKGAERDGGAGLSEREKLKIELLRGEGVRFDGRGKVVGRTWSGFTEV